MSAYDPAKLHAVQKVRPFMANGVLAEWLNTEVYPLLEAMAEEIRGSAAKISKAETELNRAEQERDSALATARRLRDGNAGYAELVATLQSIARNPKGAKSIAAEALAKVGEGGKA